MAEYLRDIVVSGLHEVTDPSKAVILDSTEATSGTSMKFVFQQTQDRIWTFSDADGTPVGSSTFAVLTRKDITDRSNVVRATQLGTSGADVVISGAAEPEAGQVLVATGPATATWQTPPATGVTDVTASDPLEVGGTASSPNIELTGIVPVSQGGTGRATASGLFDDLAPSDAAGEMIVRSGGTNVSLAPGPPNSVLVTAAGMPTWTPLPLSAGGTVTAVTASAPLASSGGAAPNITLQGIVPVANGGTGQNSVAGSFDALAPSKTVGQMIYNTGTTNVALPAGASGRVLTVGAGATPSWQPLSPPSGGTVISVGATAPLNVNGTATHPNVYLQGVVPVENGGTGQTTLTGLFDAIAPTTAAGDLIYNNAGANDDLHVGAAGTVLTSTGSAPTWAPPPAQTAGTVTAVTASAPLNVTGPAATPTIGLIGIVPPENGGTGQNSFAGLFDALAPAAPAGSLITNDGSGNVPLVLGTNNQVLEMAGATPAWTTLPLPTPGTVTAVHATAPLASSGGNVTPNISLTGVLPLGQGGTGESAASDAFDALAPTQAAGDLIMRNASTNVRLAAGSEAQVLRIVSGVPTWAANVAPASMEASWWSSSGTGFPGPLVTFNPGYKIQWAVNPNGTSVIYSTSNNWTADYPNNKTLTLPFTGTYFIYFQTQLAITPGSSIYGRVASYELNNSGTKIPVNQWYHTGEMSDINKTVFWLFNMPASTQICFYISNDDPANPTGFVSNNCSVSMQYFGPS